MLFMAVVVLIPVIPFLFFGASMESWAEQWRERPQSREVTAAVVFGLLAGDIFLPTPSSMVSTFAGWQLGAVGGTIVSWAGMSFGAIVGFALARRFGPAFARWFTKEEDLGRIDAIAERYGAATLLLTRCVPVLAEASVLIMGAHRLKWRSFLPPVLLGNLGLSLAYAGFGDEAQKHQWLPYALAISIGLPVLFAAIAVRFLPKSTLPEEDDKEQRS